MIGHCEKANIDDGYKILKSLWDKGYFSVDIISNIFWVYKTHQISEHLKLEFIKVSNI